MDNQDVMEDLKIEAAVISNKAYIYSHFQANEP